MNELLEKVSMICEECESVMQWRSTNQITNIAKYKCPHCGHVQLGESELKPLTDEPKIPNYYHLKNGRWIVKKTQNHKLIYVGTFGNEETAKRVVKEMIKNDWDKKMVPQVYVKLNIQRVDRAWVCV